MKKRHALLIGILAVIILYGVFSTLSFVANALGDAEYGAMGGGDVAILPITGIITTQAPTGLFSTASTSSTQMTRWIEDANEDESIEAILLEINSPGGSAVASDEIVQALKRVDKPVVAWIRESGASGGYWIASEADHIIANRMSITGSVGVIASYLNFGEFLDDNNITYQQLTSGEDKDIGTPLHELSQRQEGLLQEKLDRIHEFFVEDVAQNRNLTEQQQDQISSGIFYLGVEAYELGLVDELGTRAEVEAHLEEVLGREPTYSRYQERRSFTQELFGMSIPRGQLQIEAR